MRKQLLFCKGLSRLLHTAGRSQMIAFDKSRACNLFCLSLVADSNKQVALAGCQLIKHVFIGFLILVDDLFHGFANVTGGNAVPGRKKVG